jgi:glycosyltransferase involved in cell wall biosynthesis
MTTPILFVHYGDEWIRGSERCQLDLLAHLDRNLFEPVVWCNSQTMAAAVRNMGIRVYQSPFRFMLTSFRPRFSTRGYLEQIHTGLRLAREHKVRLIHCNGAGPTQWMLPVARLRSIPIITQLHASYLKRDRYVFGCRWADCLVGVSAEAVNGFRSDGVADRQIRIIHNGVDSARLENGTADPRLHALRSPARQIVTFTGSLIHRKGVDILLRAFRLLYDLEPRAELLILGDGPEQRSLHTMAQNLGIAPRVHFLGACNHVGVVYRDFTDIAVHPARAEAFGLVLAEAGYFGIPAAASNVGGIPEVVLDGETGLLCEPESPDSLAATLKVLIRNPELRRRLGRAARERILQHFTVERMARNFAALYGQLTDSGRPS